MPEMPFIVASNLAGLLDPGVPIAASRCAYQGLLNLEFAGAYRWKTVIDTLERFTVLGHGELWIKIDAPVAAQLDTRDLHENISTLVLNCSAPLDTCDHLITDLGSGQQRRLIVECCDVTRSRAAHAHGAAGIIAKGNEAGGWIGSSNTFVLVQALLDELDLPIWAYGGIGLHTAAAFRAAGAAGIIMDEQLALTRESTIPDEIARYLNRTTPPETIVLGATLGHLCRVHKYPQSVLLADLQQLEAKTGDDAIKVENFLRQLGGQLGWKPKTRSLWPLGETSFSAAPLSRKFLTTSALLNAFAEAADTGVEQAAEAKALAEGSPLAKAHRTRYPILQGPMTRVSDCASFAAAVAKGGGLPFLALALMAGDDVRTLLQETKERLAGHSWGVGLLGFADADLRAKQFAVVRDIKPGFAIIAGGRPDQAADLETNGIMTYLHVPSPQLLTAYIHSGARRFIFEGSECGGHIGPRSSLVLWQLAVEGLLKAIDDGVAPIDLHIVFAGGIHDARSAAMAAAIAGPLTVLGVKFGVLLGTAYLFTHEAVATGAIVETFQRQALACEHTRTLESGLGHITRCADTPFARFFTDTRLQLLSEGHSADSIRETLEQLNLGRLRIASKGLIRNPEFGRETKAPRLSAVAVDEQREQGLYMIGEVATLRRRVITLTQLHADIAASAGDLAAAVSRPACRPVHEKPRNKRKPANVAIIGIGCLLPGASDPEHFWANILDQVDAITEIPPDRFEVDRYFDANPSSKDKIYSRWGGFIDEIPFDPLQYGIPPKAMSAIDPLQILTLEVARSALHDAGYLNRPFPSERTAVLLGAGGGLGDLGMQYGLRAMLPQYQTPVPEEVLSALPEWTEDSFPGILLNIAAGRVSNRFDLGGVNFIVDAACGSSLAALSLAVRELEDGTSDMVLAGGVDTVQSPFGYICFSKTQAISPHGRSKPFDTSADGIAISEGLAMVVLKRLADAERDGDHIYAVIRGVAGSSDGRDRSLTAPRPAGQMRALRRAYQEADIRPATIGLLEAHGTGTAIGDLSEADALTQVFQPDGAAPESIALGSVKSQIGHTKSAAGTAGLIKIALALERKVLPPTMHMKQPIAPLSNGNSPFFVPIEPLPWIRSDPSCPRRAAVSAFGFGGTNFHAVLEEYTEGVIGSERIPTRQSWPAELLLWFERSPGELIERLQKLERALATGSSPLLRDLATSLWRNLASADDSVDGGVRLAIIARSIEELRGQLSDVCDQLATGRAQSDTGRGIFLHQGAISLGKVALLFPGQGSQAVGMLRDLSIHFGEFRDVFERANQLLAARLEKPLHRYVYAAPAFTDTQRRKHSAALTDTQVAQPALGAIEWAAFLLLRRMGINPDMVAGHSYGEYVALAAAGVLDETQLLELSEARGRIIKEAVEECPGAMAAIGAKAEDIMAQLQGMDGVWPVNMNSPRQTVIAGRTDDIEKACDIFRDRRLPVQMLPVACAFHSPLMEPARKQFEIVLEEVSFRPPVLPVYSNSLASPYPAKPKEVRELLAAHLVNPVRFADQIRAMYTEGARTFIEVGPGRVLTKLVDQTLENQNVNTLALEQSSGNGLVNLLSLLARVAVLGGRLDLGPLFADRNSGFMGLHDLLQQSKSTEPAAHFWYVNGGRARPIKSSTTTSPVPDMPPVSKPQDKAPGKTQSHPENRPIPARSAESKGADTPPPSSPSSAMTASSATPTAPPDQSREPIATHNATIDPVMQQYHALMSQFLATQSAVMTAYLQGAKSSSSNRPPILDSSLSSSPPPWPPESESKPYPSSDFLHPQTPAPTDPGTDPRAVIAGHVPLSPRQTTVESKRQPSLDAPTLVLEIVAECTGYPADTLNPKQVLEADLGIDSIKRVEIFTTLQARLNPEQAVELTQAMDRLTAASTLQDIISIIQKATAKTGPASDPETSKHDFSASDLSPQGRVAQTAITTQATPTDRLLDIVVELTGYPRDVITPEASLETDLGIDSIKRVEILSVYQNDLPEHEQKSIQHMMDQLTGAATLKEMARLLTRATDALDQKSAKPSGDSASPGNVDTAPEAVSRWLLRAQPIAHVNRDLLRVPDSVVIVTDDGNGIAIALIDALRQHGKTAVLLRHIIDETSAEESADAEVRRLDFKDAFAVQAAVEQIRATYGPIRTIVHLGPLSGGPDPLTSTIEELRNRIRSQVKIFYLLAQAAAQDLQSSNATQANGNPALVAAATMLGGRFGSMPDDPIDPIQCGVTALARTLALEWPTVDCRTIDIAAGQSAQHLAELLLEELCAADGKVQVGRRADERFAPIAIPSPLPARQTPPPLDRDSVVLFTGGARGITANIALELATRFGPRIVLVGRTPPPQPEDYDTRDLPTGAPLKAKLAEKLRADGEKATPARIDSLHRALCATREITGTMEAIAATGSSVEYISADVRDVSTFANVIDDIKLRYGRIDTVIHGAGIIEDKLIVDKKPDSFDRVVFTKTDGAFVLASKLDPDTLKMLGFMTSVSATYGNPGQADYAAANGILNGLAALLCARWPKARAVGLNWGPWDAEGMVKDNIRRQFLARGIGLVPPAAGAAAVINEIAAGQREQPIVVYGDGPWGHAEKDT